MLSLLAVTALSLQMLAPYLAWPSRWNIPAHISAGFCVTAYVIPGLLTDVWDRFPVTTTTLFVQVNLLGAVAMCLGVVLGNFLARGRAVTAPSAGLRLSPDASRMIWRVMLVSSICVGGMFVAYAIMGFIPMFAEDPFSARQFKGIYRDPYYRVAYLYRFSFSVLQASIPLLLTVAWFRRSGTFLLIAFLAVAVLFISLSRGPTAMGVLFFAGILAARHKGYLKWYIALLLLIFPLGSLLFYVLGQVFEIDALRDGYVGESFSDFVSSGAPDIVDQMTWLHGFMRGDYFSWGRTIYGGLVPSNYPWNPAVWSLTYDRIGADVTEIVSGGLRLSPAEWGYANFSWLGVILLPLLSGIFNGLMLYRLKTWLPSFSVLQFATAMMVYMTLGQQIVNFYLLSIHNLPAIFVGLFFWFGLHARTGLVPRERSLPAG